MTLQLVMIYHHTMFGYKRLSSLEEFIQTNEILKVHCDLGCDVTTAVQYFHYFGFKRIISSKDIVKF